MDMEYIIIILLVILLIISVISLMKNINEAHITERIGKLETNVVKELGDFKNDFSRDLNSDFIALNERLENKLNLINDRVNERLDENFKSSNKTFMSVLERLSKIDEAQKKIESLSSDIVSLQSILTDKKTRGIFGEVNLKNILVNVFGENNDKIYKLQYTFDNGVIADSVLFAPEPLGVIAIDSKFPLEHYRIMVDKNKSELERDMASKQFKTDMKHHIDAISSKYIIPGITSDQAIMFLPAEAIFAEVNAYYQDVIEYAYKKRVWIVSPTTLISTLTTIQVIMTNIEKDKYASVIHKELNLLSEEFGRYKERWDKLSRSIETVTKDVRDINTTTTKITKRFESINQVKLDNKDESVN
ncbi:MAG: DNA recombination protein RmuC [Firmicutes bacterium]|nr:DNA recombination protein RmuC [Bacillota bacterium]